MVELKNFMDLLFDEQPFDDRKLPRRSTGLGCPVAASSRSAQPDSLLLHNAPRPGRTASAGSCAPLPPNA